MLEVAAEEPAECSRLSCQVRFESALSNLVPGIIGECGGELTCATCQVYVGEGWADRLPPITADEESMLDVAAEHGPTSRLTRFRADPHNRGEVLDTGLWRYTRHPNYFGDACVWWGLYLIAAETGWVGAASIPGPIVITLLLTKLSGVPTLEGRLRRKRPGYEAYIQRTSGFIPLPPSPQK